MRDIFFRHLLIVGLFLAAIGVWQSPALVLAQGEPTPTAPESPADPADLQATVDAQAERLSVLEEQFTEIEAENALALDRAIFNFITRPAIFVGAILTGLGILLIWRSSGDIADRLRRLETHTQQTLEHFSHQQEMALTGRISDLKSELNEQTVEMQRDRVTQADLDRMLTQIQLETGSVDGRLLKRAKQLLERVMLPIRLPRGYNLGHVYERLQLCGFENLCWYDNLGDRPMGGITVILVRSIDDAARFRSLMSRFSPAPRPRETAFILYIANSNIQIESVGELQIDFPNIALARSPLEIATQALTISWGLHPITPSQYGSTE